jgi:predicted patatin/cPLA2 family phospholipase
MPNKPIPERIATMEANFANMKDNLHDINFKVTQIYEQLPEIVRKVNKHHETYANDQIQIAKIEPMNVRLVEMEKQHPANDKGKERRKGRWERMPLYQKILTIGAIIAVFFRPEIQEILSTLIKTYLGIE